MTLPKTLHPDYGEGIRLGRPLSGELRECKDCGKDIYVRRYRVKETGNYCLDCSRKHLPEYARRPRKSASTPMKQRDFYEQLLMRVNKCLGEIEELLATYKEDRNKLGETFQVLEMLTRVIQAEKEFMALEGDGVTRTGQM